MWRLLGNLSHPNSGAQLLELDPPKGLGEEVSELVLGVDIAGLDAPLIQAASDEVVLDADALMEVGVLCQEADLLSTLSSTASASLPRRLPSSRTSQRARFKAVVAAMYSASQLDRATTCCLTDCQLIRHLPRKNNVPPVLLLVSMSPVRLQSLYPMKCSAPGHVG